MKLTKEFPKVNGLNKKAIYGITGLSTVLVFFILFLTMRQSENEKTSVDVSGAFKQKRTFMSLPQDTSEFNYFPDNVTYDVTIAKEIKPPEEVFNSNLLNQENKERVNKSSSDEKYTPTRRSVETRTEQKYSTSPVQKTHSQEEVDKIYNSEIIAYENTSYDELNVKGEYYNTKNNAINTEFQSNGRLNNEWNSLNNMAIIERPASKYILQEGTIIPAILITEINSNLPSDVIIGQITRNIYDSIKLKYLIIPKGSKIIGSYSNQLALGQKKLILAWDRIIFPDGRSVTIPPLNSYDNKGVSGVGGKIKNHFWKVFATATMVSIIGSGVSIATGNTTRPGFGNYLSPKEMMAQDVAVEFNRIASRILEQGLRVSPTIEISKGTSFNILMNSDLPFEEPYKTISYNYGED